MNLFTLHSQTNKNNIFIYGHWIRSTYDTMLLIVAIFPNSSMMCILSTGWMRTKSHTARVVKRSMFLLLFLYLTTTFQISPSLLNSISWTIPYWYVFTTEPSFLVNKKTLQIFTSRSLRNHFGCSINFGTCDISHVSNHTLKIFLFFSSTFRWFPTTFIGETGVLLLFLPSFNWLGVINSMFSKSLTIFPSAKGKSLIAFNTSAEIVSHCSTDNHWFEIVFSKDSFTYLILHSTFPL